METQSKEETKRVIGRLRTALRLLGFTNREIERRLGYTPSYLTRLFSGQIELRFEHVVDIVNAIGMTAEEFFQFAYPVRPGERSEPAIQLNEILEELRPASGRRAVERDDIEKELERLTKLFRHNADIVYSRLSEQMEREREEWAERDRERRAAKKAAAKAPQPSSRGSGKPRSA